MAVTLRERALDTVLDISGIAACAAQPGEAAQESLTALRALVPYAAATLAAWDPVTERHVSVANVDYPERVLDYLLTGFVSDDPAYRMMRNQDPAPLRMHDTPFDYYDTYSYQEVFGPAGYREGMTALLFTRDGRYTGAMHVSADRAADLTPEARAVAWRLQAVLATVVDRMKTPGALASAAGATLGAALVARDGRVLSVPGYEHGELLDSGAALPKLVGQLRADVGEQRHFLWRLGRDEFVDVRTHRIEDGTVVSVREFTSSVHLTTRELEVLTLIASGMANAEIAERLVLSRRTVETYVEHLLGKLRCVSRTGCARRAVELGLEVMPLPGEPAVA